MGLWEWSSQTPVISLSDHGTPMSEKTGLEKIFDGGFGAGDRIRTGDIDLGKVALYQLSYSRPDVTTRSQRSILHCRATIMESQIPPSLVMLPRNPRAGFWLANEALIKCFTTRVVF
jgi:hypothetical protein